MLDSAKSETPNHRQREFMQHLRAGGWVKAIMIPTGGPIVIAKLLNKGWIEKRGEGRELAYRITEKGLDAKKAPVWIL
jgi:hypothetical protein